MPEISLAATLFTKDGVGRRPQARPAGATTVTEDSDDRVKGLVFQDAPGHGFGGDCCCKATGIYVRVVDVECTICGAPGRAAAIGGMG